MTTITDQIPDPNQLVLVTGGTGKTGRRITQRLSALAVPVRVASRHGHPAFDWHDRGTWVPVLDGVTAAWLAFSPDLAAPGADELMGEFAGAARDAEVERLVLLSGRGEEGALAAEHAVQSVAPSWNVLRCSWFHQNFSEDLFLDGVRAGVLALPAGDATEPFLDADDIAEVAVAALTGAIEADVVLELTGPRLLGFADVAVELSAATGRPIDYVPVSDAEFRTHLRHLGVDDDLAEALGALMGQLRDGRNASTTDTVARVLGRPARDFAAYARDAATTGVWDVPEPAEARS